MAKSVKKKKAVKKRAVKKAAPVELPALNKVIHNEHLSLKKYEEEPRFESMTVHQMVEVLRKDPNAQIEAELVGINSKTLKPMRHTITDRSKFLEAFDASNEIYKTHKKTAVKFLESGFNTDDSFARDSIARFGGTIGNDFIPLLGGPFFKQLYLQDMQKQGAEAFFAYHKDPLANNLVNILVDFTLGRGWKCKFEDKEDQVVWDAFVEANDLENQMTLFARELSIYGEAMPWILPGNAVNIAFDVSEGQDPGVGLIPRVRLIDPTSIWEVVTYPEDVNRVLFYQMVLMTPYNLYTGTDGGNPVPSSKFVFKQIPPDEVIHARVNSLSNEKRGRSDFAPIFNYLKRMRDLIDYSLAAQQKAAAWCMDTTVEGNQGDLDRYVASQRALGPIPPAASEFVHTAKIKREYLSNSANARGSGQSEGFEWTLTMICSGFGVPVSYVGSHLSSGQTRASAVVATEPVFKRFEGRRQIYSWTLERIKRRVFKLMGRNPYAAMETNYPEIYTQDRDAKAKRFTLYQENEWIAPETAAAVMAKEEGLDDYNYANEKEKIQKAKADGSDPLSATNPLTAPAQNPLAAPKAPTAGVKAPSPAGLSGNQRKGLRDNLGGKNVGN